MVWPAQALAGAGTGGLTEIATLRALAAKSAPLKRDRSEPLGRAKPKLMSEIVFSHSVSPSGPATVTCTQISILTDNRFRKLVEITAFKMKTRLGASVQAILIIRCSCQEARCVCRQSCRQRYPATLIMGRTESMLLCAMLQLAVESLHASNILRHCQKRKSTASQHD